MNEVNWLEIFGYVASVITGVSLTMSSLIRLRWLNLLGAFCFGTYGVLLGATPVAALNYFICCANIYYLWKIYTEKAHFRILPVSTKDQYIREYIELHKAEIKEFFPPFHLSDNTEYSAMMIHRDLALAGLFICHRVDETTMEVDLDFVLPPYRDLKPGQFVFQENSAFFTSQGVKRIISCPGSDGHVAYLERIGFKRTGDKLELMLG